MLKHSNTSCIRLVIVRMILRDRHDRQGGGVGRISRDGGAVVGFSILERVRDVALGFGEVDEHDDAQSEQRINS